VSGRPFSRWRLARRVFAVAFALFMLAPLAVILIVSFTGETFVRFPPHAFGVHWYVEAFQNPYFRGGLVVSVRIAVIVALISGVLGVLGALVLGRYRFPGRDAILSVLLMPVAIPHIVIAIALLQFMAVLALPAAPLGIIGGHILITLPFVLRLTMTSVIALDPAAENASYSLGASPYQTFRYVVLPMIAPGAAAGTIFAFLISFDEVTISLFLALPGHTTLPAEIFSFASQGSDPVITAVSGAMIIFAIGLMLLVERFYGVLRLMADRR
jgi:putative spermidine/putrescine transport system permease protein